jgi:hypothetical protein
MVSFMIFTASVRHILDTSTHVFFYEKPLPLLLMTTIHTVESNHFKSVPINSKIMSFRAVLSAKWPLTPRPVRERHLRSVTHFHLFPNEQNSRTFTKGPLYSTMADYMQVIPTRSTFAEQTLMQNDETKFKRNLSSRSDSLPTSFQQYIFRVPRQMVE